MYLAILYSSVHSYNYTNNIKGHHKMIMANSIDILMGGWKISLTLPSIFYFFLPALSTIFFFPDRTAIPIYFRDLPTYFLWRG